MSAISRVLSLSLAGFLGVGPCHGQTNPWLGNGTDANWSTPGNFSTALAAGQSLIFTGNNRLTNIKDGTTPVNFASLTFLEGAGAFTLQGTAISLTAGMSNLSANLQRLQFSQMTVSGSQSWETGAGGFTINAPIALDRAGGSLALTFDGIGTITVNGAISEIGANPGSAGSLVKSGSGTLILAASNTYSGGTRLIAGTLAVGGNNGLGTGLLTVAGSATLATNGSARTIANPILAASDFSIFPRGTIVNLNSFVLNGPIDLDGGNRTITNPSNFGAGQFGNVELGGPISNGTGLAYVTIPESSAAFFSLRGSQANTYAGLTRIGTGVSVRLLKNAGVAAIPGDLRIENDGVAVVDANEQIADSAEVTAIGIGRLQVGNVNVVTEAIAGLEGDGEVAFGDDAPGSTLRVGGGDFAGTFTDGVAGGTPLVKFGPGTLTLSGVSTFLGNTAINGGALVLAGGSLPAGTVTVASGAALGGQGTVGGPVVLQSGANLAPVGGPLNLAALSWAGGARLTAALGPVAAPAQIVGSMEKVGSGSYAVDLVDAGLSAGQTYTVATFAGNVGFTAGDFVATGVPGARVVLAANALTVTVPAVQPVYGVTVRLRETAANRATFLVTNTGDTTTAFRLARRNRVDNAYRGPKPPVPPRRSPVVLTYFLAGRDLTRALPRGRARVTLAPGEAARVVVRARARFALAFRRTIRATLIATSEVQPAARDRARANLRLPAVR